MKTRGLFFLFALVAIGSFVAAVLPETPPPGDKESVLIQAMMRTLQRFHYQPMDIDDDFSGRAYDYYLNDMDGARLFFTQEDIAKFAPSKYQIDDQVNSGTYAFFDQVQEVWIDRLDITEAYFQEALAKPFDLKKGKEVTLRDDESEWLKNEKELKKYWHDYIKRDVLNQVANRLKNQEKDKEITKKLSATEIEAEVRKKTLDRYQKWYGRMRKVKVSNRRSQYLNALTAQFDPHTTYYRPKDKESFDIRFSGRLEGIGATLQNDENYTKVSTIVVGGPAWKAKELEADDLIMAVRQEGEEKALDIKDMLVEDVVQFIRGDKGTTVFLKIKKPDGTIKEISIVRDLVVIDESYAKSLIIDGEGENEKFGFLSLPAFYADFNDENGRFSAKDVAAELKKLKDNDVNGIILDLRNNGGGSLKEVIDMTGFFIPEGPVVQVAGRGQKKRVMRDTDDRVLYDGPLVVLVNQYSASASEILAAALQDYGRAVIVGSNSTFGKGTVQSFLDLDRTIAGLPEVKPLGTVKLTMQKYYRINGGSVQLRGVSPDIVLPDSRSLLETGERQQMAPLAWSQIAPADFYQDVYRIEYMDNLRESSNNRVAQNPTFQLIQENAKRVKRQRDKDTFPLTLAGYQAMKAANEEEAKKYKDLYDMVVNPKVANMEEDLMQIESNDATIERNKDFKKSVSKDVYIEEALNILADMRRMDRKG